jgi:hypothetical protein
MNFVLFRNVGTAVIVMLSVGMIIWIPLLYVQLVPGLVVMWGEIVVGLAANRVALHLTRKGIALKGIEGEENSITRRMFEIGNFTKLYLFYGLVVFWGTIFTALSIHLGGVLFEILVLMLLLPIFMGYDMIHDYFWIRRYERESEVPH